MLEFIRKYLTSRLCIVIVLLLSFHSYTQTVTFNHLTVEDGLSNNDVNTLIQDRNGFIWFGTEDGLNRFDGYNSKVYRNDPSNSNSLSNNVIWALLEDKQGNIWIGTKDGIVNIFNPLTEKFSYLIPQPKLKDWNSITALYEDRNGDIWIGTRSTGVYRFNTETKEFNHWSIDSSGNNGISHPSTRSILEDQKGNIIIGTYNGLNKLDPDTPEKNIIKYYHQQDDPNSLSANQIYNLSKSALDADIIWVGTPNGLNEFNSGYDSVRRVKVPNPDGLQFGSGASSVIEELIAGEKILWTDTYSGLLRINLTSGSYHRFVENKNDPNSLINNKINKIIKDRSGVIWIATENGISYYSPKYSRFNSPFDKNIEPYLSAARYKKNLRAIVNGKNGEVWLGFSDGLISINNSNGDKIVRSYPQFNNFDIWSLTADSNNSLWVGTYGQGLKQYNYKSGKLKDWNLIYKKTNKEVVPFIKSLLTDSDNNIWIGYWGSGLGLINPASGNSMVWEYELDYKNSINFQDVWAIKEDRFGRIWLGTPGGGLNLVRDKDKGIFEFWIHKNNDQNSLSSNSVLSICEARKGNLSKNDYSTMLWIGTSNGLNQFLITNRNGKSNLYDFDVDIKSYTVKDGLPDNSVNSILEDDQGNLWLGTSLGISFFNVKTKTFTNFSTADGLNGNNMNPGTALQLDNGLMLFGSAKGLNIFDPKETRLSDYQPAVIITDFQIFNKSVKIVENSPLKESILSTNEIILSHDQDVFSFEFAALDFNSSQSIKYAYRMEGFDNDWIKSGNRRFVTYTNLDPGNYVFKVKSTNADGVWSENIRSIKVIVNQPWWRTPFAYLSYLILIGLGLFAIRRFELNRTKLRNELKIRKFEAKQKTELEELKSRFFANLSHEFRTPLMLIKGPLELLRKNKNDFKDIEQIDTIKRNSEKLQELIDQLLELSQLENAAIPLNLKHENLVQLLRNLVPVFKTLAEQKNIFLQLKCEEDSITVEVDKDKFEKIINNLLSNALKFSNSGDKITVSLTRINDNKNFIAELEVSDTGIGIPSEKLEKIFDRFYQVDDSNKRSYGGSGIGLALVKELVDLNKWEISVDGKPGSGTTFKILIPISENRLIKSSCDQEKYLDKAVASKDELSNKQTKTVISSASLKNESLSGSDKASILIVEDSSEVRKYLRDLLQDYYQISEAENGEAGLKSASDNLPDLIISDVMMPSMDGMEFCQKIKTDWQTSDIPVILLTAKASFESKLEGLEIGADAYLTKPFESRELFVRIKNLLEQRKRIREKLIKDLKSTTEKENLNSADKEFIEKVYQLAELNLDKTNFNTDQLAKELFLSRSQLHRKMIAITGQAPGEFIRTIKLKQAARMLLEKRLPVTQVAYEIGFSSPAQFSRAFSKQFNCTPSEYSSKPKA